MIDLGTSATLLIVCASIRCECVANVGSNMHAACGSLTVTEIVSHGEKLLLQKNGMRIQRIKWPITKFLDNILLLLIHLRRKDESDRSIVVVPCDCKLRFLCQIR